MSGKPAKAKVALICVRTDGAPIFVRQKGGGMAAFDDPSEAARVAQAYAAKYNMPVAVVPVFLP